jgi:hypothetical protein
VKELQRKSEAGSVQGVPQRPVSDPERLPLAVRLVLWLVLVLVPQQPK